MVYSGLGFQSRVFVCVCLFTGSQEEKERAASETIIAKNSDED